MIRRELIAAAALILLAPAPAVAQTVQPQFAVGQVWSVKADPPTTAKVVIDRIEDFRGRTAIHVSLLDVPVPAGLAIAGPTTGIGHMPFDADALRASLDKQIGSRPPPTEFEAGYQQWRTANGGIFTISVPKAIEFVFQSAPRAQ